MSGFEECPQCGAEFRKGRLACPECGSDAETGWQDAEEIDYRSVPLPDVWPPEADARGPSGSRAGWWIALALALLAAIVMALLW